MAIAKVGELAPNFALAAARPDDTAKTLGRKISLEDYRGKWLVFFFYSLEL